MKYFLFWIVLAILASIPLLTYAFSFSKLLNFNQEVVLASYKVEQVEPIKTLDSEINRLSIKYNVSSTTAKAIITCESSMYPKAINENVDENGIVWSKDYGWFQVNDYFHEATMTKLGLDIHDQWDSLEYGFMLLKSQGVKPWKASSKCWSKLI
jgi:hypothetical protein